MERHLNDKILIDHQYNKYNCSLFYNKYNRSLFCETNSQKYDTT